MYDSKQALREAMLKKRNSFSNDILKEMGHMIQAKVMEMDEFAMAETVGAYCSIGTEVNTMHIIRAVLEMKKKLALPKVRGESIYFAEVRDIERDLERGQYKIMEPKDHCAKTETMDLILIPGIAWDMHGHRLGYGKGYYDRYLSNINASSIGLAYDFQVLESIPHDKDDFNVKMIVTEKRVIHT
jgi:5-formyltetrahydrofolate cyclo-ligase